MNQYKRLFNDLLSHPIQAFGYERWTADDIYFGFSNMSAIAELFIESNALEDQNVIIQPKYVSSFCAFIYPDAEIYNPKYNHFRNSLEENLKIRISFCMIKRQVDYCEAFVWNFKKPPISLQEEKQIITNDFLKNNALINTCIEQFKKDLAVLLPKKIITGINISENSPFYRNSKRMFTK